jgi:hypothetical protein
MYVSWRGQHQLVMLQDVAGDAQQAQLSSTSALQVEARWSFKSLMQSLVRRAQCMSEAVFGLDPALLLQARQDAAADAEARRVAELAAERERTRVAQAAAAEAQTALQAERERADAAQQAADAARSELAIALQQLQQLREGRG